MRRLTITIRTADRHPGENYLGATVRSLTASGIAPDQIHVVATSPKTGWLGVELGDLPVVRHVPTRPRTPNANGIAQVEALELAPAEWLVMLEDDITVCDDFHGSVLRWLDRHATPEVHVYRFCAFGPPQTVHRDMAVYPLREQRGSQAIALRAGEARDFAAWATSRATTWRPRRAPFQHEPTKGFDKLVGYWALDRWPSHRVGYVSHPHFVRHVGVQSGLYRHTVVNHGQFSRQAWPAQEDHVSCPRS